MNSLLCSINSSEKSGIDFKGIKYFKEVSICHNISKKIKAEIDSILYMKADIFIGEIRLVKNEKMISNEGIILTGYKLRVELIINEFFKYSTKFNNLPIGIVRNNLIKTVQIAVPESYSNIKIEDLYRKKRIVVRAYLEDMYCDKHNGAVDSNLTILVNCTINEY